MSVRASRPVVTTLLLSAALALGSAPLALTAAAAAPPGTRTLAAGTSGFPQRLDVVGVGAGRIVFGTLHQADGGEDGFFDGIETVPVSGGALTAVGGLGADAYPVPISLAGSTLVFDEDEVGTHPPFWLDTVTHATGQGRDDQGATVATWQVAVPGGGAWVSDTGGPLKLLTTTTGAPNATPTVLAPLVGIGERATARAEAADANGVAVVSGATLDYYSLASHTMRKLDTGGAAAAGFTCTSASAAAIGCFSATTVLSVPTNGSAPTVVRGRASQVAVGPGVLAWVARSGGALTIVRNAGTPAATSARSTSAVLGVATDGSTVVYGQAAGVAGIYRARGSAVTGSLLVRAPQLPRQTATVALTDGRVAWIDDSTRTYPVRARRVLQRAGAALSVGPLIPVSPGSAQISGTGFPYFEFSSLAVSGDRTLFTTGGHLINRRLPVGSVVLADSTGRHVLSMSGNGEVDLSASYAAWMTPAGRVTVRNLATGVTRDLTSILGLHPIVGAGPNPNLSGALSGRYLAYASGGRARRLDLVTGRSVVVGSNAAGGIVTGGDWVIWQSQTSPAGPIYYRNARTMGRTFRVSTSGSQLVGASAAGYVFDDAAGRQVFRAWGAGANHLLPGVPGPVRVDGGLMAWVGLDGYPKVAPLPAATR